MPTSSNTSALSIFFNVVVPRNLFGRLRHFAKHNVVAPGTSILKQGEVNERPCILAVGQVQVTVEGEVVAVLDKAGDLMGEISVLMRYPITASLIALTKVEFLEIHASDLAKHILQSENDFGHQLYRAISSVLPARIIKTKLSRVRF